MDHLLLTPADGAKLIGGRVRAARRRRRWTQDELAQRADVSVATIARLERTGHAQLASFLQVCTALGHLRDVDALLVEPEPRTLSELRQRR